MVIRFLFGIIFAAGYVVLDWDVLTLGRRTPVLAATSVAE
jgi:hypothetical protein